MLCQKTKYHFKGHSQLWLKQYGLRLCDKQISYEMVSNAHARQLTVSL